MGAVPYPTWFPTLRSWFMEGTWGWSNNSKWCSTHRSSNSILCLQQTQKQNVLRSGLTPISHWGGLLLLSGNRTRQNIEVQYIKYTTNATATHLFRNLNSPFPTGFKAGSKLAFLRMQAHRTQFPKMSSPDILFLRRHFSEHLVCINTTQKYSNKTFFNLS